MNNKPTLVVIMWESRNWRKLKKAKTWCMDYGLFSLMRNVFAGTLYPKEYSTLRTRLRATFNLTTDIVTMVPLCQTCSGTLNNQNEDVVKTRLSYEIITL